MIFAGTVLINLYMVMLSLSSPDDFIAEQKKYERVRTAFKEKQASVDRMLADHELTGQDLNVLFVAFKDEDVLEVYGKQKQESTFKKITSYKICSKSGQPGPKRREGDRQVPEGFYHIDRFNPVSNFYLSLGINYPNVADRRKIKSGSPGGDIFIHGSCVTIGCLPMTDDYIKEIYVLAVLAKNNGQSKIPVYIFPFRMTNQNFSLFREKYRADPGLLLFWENLKTGYDKFDKEKRELIVNVAANGDYRF